MTIAERGRRFRKLVVTMPERVRYGTEYIPPRRYEIQLRDLQVLSAPAETVFAKAE
ncbi:hypothetical protein HQ590_01250 [bacterium]|nr:hypothetical protein [bacterium]